MESAYLVPVQGASLHVVERGHGRPLIVLHGGPGLDHHMFGPYLDPLAREFRLLLVDQRSQGLSTSSPEETWSLEQSAQDVTDLAEALGLTDYAVLGHSWGAMVALQHAVDCGAAAYGAAACGAASATIVSAGIPSGRYLSHVAQSLAAFGPPELREQVVISWARERTVGTPEEVAALLADQLPFHFADPQDPRIAAYRAATEGTVYAPEVLRHYARAEDGGIEVEGRLGDVRQPVLVLAGRHDRTCPVEAARAIAAGVPDGRLEIFEQSGHMLFVEETAKYVEAVAAFLRNG